MKDKVIYLAAGLLIGAGLALTFASADITSIVEQHKSQLEEAEASGDKSFQALLVCLDKKDENTKEWLPEHLVISGVQFNRVKPAPTN